MSGPGPDVSWSRVIPRGASASREMSDWCADIETLQETLDSLGLSSASGTFTKIVNAQNTEFGAVGDRVTDETVALQAWLDKWGTRTYFFLPTATGYLIDGTLLQENFHSAVIQGPGRNFSGAITQTSSTTAPILRLGGQSAGGSEPFDTVIRDICLDANENNMATAVLEFGKVNRFELHGVGIKDWNTGAGISNVDYGSSTLFQNMTFRECRLVGFNQSNSVGYNLLLSDSAYFTGGSIELCNYALVLVGNGKLVPVYLNGIRIERTNIALDVEDIAVKGEFDGVTAPVKLGQGCIGCDIDLGVTRGSGESQSIVDANFGNRYKNVAPHTVSGAYESSPSIDFDGGEWLRVLNSNPDPVFRDQNLDEWTTSNATIISKAITLPGAHGRAMAVTATAANGYAERAIYPDDSEDFLLTVCFLVNANTGQNSRIEVIDQSGPTTLWNSGTLDFSGIGVAGDNSVFRFVRKRIPVPAGAGGTNELRVRIYSVTSGKVTLCPLLMFSKSEFDMESDASGDVTVSGSGVGAQLVYSEVTNTTFVIGNTTNYENVAGAFLHIQTDISASGLVIGLVNDTNNARTGPVWPTELFKAGDAFNLVSPVYPFNSRLSFRGFSGGDITVSEVTLHAIGRKNPWGLLSKHEDSALSATTTRVLGVVPALCVMTRLSARLFVNTQTTASGANYWTVEVIRTRGGSDTVIATVDSQSGWSAGDAITLGERNRTVEPGDIIKVVYTKTSAPTDLEPTISINFGWDD